jgi:hypothetical protein
MPQLPLMRRLALLSFVVLWAAHPLPAADSNSTYNNDDDKNGDRFVVTWRDGVHTSAAEIEQWGAESERPTLAGRRLFDRKNPARLILDTTLRRRKIESPYLELQSGDLVRGRVLKFQAADEASGTPAHFVFEPEVRFDLPGVFSRPQTRVREDFVRRIVARSSLARPSLTKEGEPENRLQTGDGARESFRSWQWHASGVRVLTASGTKEFALSELAAIEWNRPDDWDAWLRQLALLSPAVDSPLLRMELADGTRLTTSLERLRPVTAKGDGPDHWFHVCQPAWSLDLLAVPHRQVRMRTIFDAVETPLSDIEPAASRGEGMILPTPIGARRDESLSGDGLYFGGHEFGWGFAVHAPYQLTFELPASARRFRTRLALDPSVGQGGCARGLVQVAGRTVYTSPLLIGGSESFDTGPLEIAAARLTLAADPAAENRPADADPLDIRDHLNWLEPTIEHDRGKLRRAVRRKFPSVHSGLAAWTLEPAEAGNWRLVNRLDEFEAASGGFRPIIALAGPCTLSRRVALRSSPALQLTFGRSIPSEAAELEVWIDANRVLRTTLPQHAAIDEPLRIDVPLPGDAPESAVLSLRLAPAGKTAFIDWRGGPLRP